MWRNVFLYEPLDQRDRLRAQVGNDLNRLRQDRNRADYIDEWSGGIDAPDKTVEATLIIAARTIANIGRLAGT